VVGMKQPNDHAEPTKSRTLKKQTKNKKTFSHAVITNGRGYT